MLNKRALANQSGLALRGRKIAVAINMLRSVARLDEASNTASECPGLVLEGSWIGTRDARRRDDHGDAELRGKNVSPSLPARKPMATNSGASTPSNVPATAPDACGY
ncbi:hypothetical protein [Tardiphaga sp. vice154]|uniref:hypothetical protein n=1 Tax=Tardiphaga sp. vice154 TaxID=2592814 RepID=UPI001AEDEB72|nr:hypothetical protein [Tardiphaga sp. vice154]